MSAQSNLLSDWLILKRLADGKASATVRELAADLAVDEKTIRRALTRLQKVGFLLDEEVARHGRKIWKLQHPAQNLTLGLTYDEALALALGRQFLDPVAGTFLGESAARAHQKLRAGLSTTAINYVERVTRHVYHTELGQTDYSEKGEALARFVDAIAERRITLVTYQSERATEPVEYEYCPYFLTRHHGSLYVDGFSSDHRRPITFKLNRVESVALTTLRFQDPPGLNHRDYFSKSFGVYHGDGDHEVIIRFSKAVARYVAESRWPALVSSQRQRDGSHLATFRLTSTHEIKRWIASFGPNAEVIAPDSLREEIVADLRMTLAVYETPKAAGGDGRKPPKVAASD